MRKRDENIEEKNQPPLLMTASFFNFESSPNSDSGSDELEEEWQKSKQEFLSALYHAESYASERESLQMPALDAEAVETGVTVLLDYFKLIRGNLINTKIGGAF
ncbi:hypothetical protein [Coxiella burnetii]|uniref:hypothetical protein n=2 Tax=Coxiella burnetii TaxID=777 RepID=UPI00001838BC|nr:hypothetical protein [Coxiella burnetii]ABX77924.1 hypothetical protein COXBURSA331_A1249 [Coxiella burnetii RSA 331]ARI65919.1 hypothetical protein B7L74_05710 [Coxiella burnetii]ARK27383.1 hypothetical protein BMW92_05540 [Coxiella burnetii]ATN82209.1 hypothetical protein AYO24_05880 [Coxiella burnetii]ATN84111.1 hypothetical protein AYO23_05895 [Coxiella burnetii]